MFLIDFNLYRICKRFRPQLLVSFGSPYSAHIGHWFHIPSVTMVDTEPEPFTLFHWESRIVFQLFVKKIFVPNSYKRKFLVPRVVRFAGFKELAYLHPHYFKPDPSVLQELHIRRGEKIVLVKFAAWDAIHDVNHTGFIGDEQRVNFVRALQKYGRVFISSEVDIPELRHLYLPLPPGDVHHLLAHADLYVGEGATMAAEAGVLGVPWVFLSSRRLGYLDFQSERYHSGQTCATPASALLACKDYLILENVHESWQKKREKLLRENRDVTAMILDEIEMYAGKAANSQR